LEWGSRWKQPGVKTSVSNRDVIACSVRAHLAIRINALIKLRDCSESVKHLRFESQTLSFDCEPIEIFAGFGIESIDGFDLSGYGGLYFVDEPLDFIGFSFDNNLDSSIVKILDCSRDNKRLGYLGGPIAKTNALNAA